MDKFQFFTLRDLVCLEKCKYFTNSAIDPHRLHSICDHCAFREMEEILNEKENVSQEG